MFVNDVTGLCRNNVFGFDYNTQIPMGFNPVNNIPYNWGLGQFNSVGQYFHPAYGMVVNRFPQTLGQGIGQTFGQNFGQNFPTFGNQLNTPFVPFFPQQVPFANSFVGQNHLVPNTLGIGYGINPWGVTNWNTPMGFQSGFCR